MMVPIEKSYDIIIIGGGISGLYTAWRLCRDTQLSVAVLEASHRFGGRYQTCIMPGGFPADLGAMRFIPAQHPLLHQLVQELNVPIERLFGENCDTQSEKRYFFRNQHVQSLDEMLSLYSIQREDEPYFIPSMSHLDVCIPESGNLSAATIGNSDQLARDMSLSQYLTTSGNAECLNKGYDQYPVSMSMADAIGTPKAPLDQHFTPRDGMESIITGLLNQLQKIHSCRLYANHNVTRIDEQSDGFSVKVVSPDGDRRLTCKKLVLACNGRGMELISWNSEQERTTQLQKLLGKLERVKGFKVFLTYNRPWWEDFGFNWGTLRTDLPLGEVMAFGERSHTAQFATLLAGFTFKYTEIFEGLNNSSAQRYPNCTDTVPEELTPSKRLVDYVQRLLAKIFGVAELPSPVCAAAKVWSSDPIGYSQYYSRVGVDSNTLYWTSLKPFPDADVFIAGDTFVAYEKSKPLLGWSESCLLTCERVLNKYFNLSPYIEGITLKNVWPDEENNLV